MRITLGYSPCPNDTFIFGALANGLIDTQGLEFEVVLDDVEALNRMAAAAQLDITKLSYHAFAHLTSSYQLLNSGSALGNGCGPLLVARKPLDSAQVEQAHIAIPGRMTTANFLLSLAFPKATHKTEVLFSAIEDGVVNGQFDAGLIIHENRFTYQQKGLVKLMDLGDFWEGDTGEPIPLGGIVAKRSLGTPIQKKVEALVRESLAFAYRHPDAIMPYIRAHAQAMDDAVMQSHIDLYVNDYSLDLGEKGRAAVGRMFDMATEKGIVPHIEPDFLLA